MADDLGTKSPDTAIWSNAQVPTYFPGGHPAQVGQMPINATGNIGSTTFSNAAAVDLAVTPGVYEFEFFDNGNLVSGTPENFYFTSFATATATLAWLRTGALNRRIVINIPPAITTVSFLGTSANVTGVAWRKILQPSK